MTIATELEAVEVRVAEVRPVPSQPENPLFAAILAEVGGGRGWLVVMRKPEADNLALHLRGVWTERPMTYSFMAALVGALGGRVLEARITAADGRTIFASATVDGPNGRQVLDARPSDALNLALRTGAPIRVAPEALTSLQKVDLARGSPAIEWV